ncbi:MAG: hypothetical protein R8L53_08215 [Mariprofundales bacterium]
MEDLDFWIFAAVMMVFFWWLGFVATARLRREKYKYLEDDNIVNDAKDDKDECQQEKAKA